MTLSGRISYYTAYGTTMDSCSSGITEIWNNAVLPGELRDDSGHFYDVSRRCPAKPEQVNAIIKASEKYAEGGYSLFDRNCGTFVRKMVVNKAHPAAGGDFFEQSEVEFSHWENFGMFGASAFRPNAGKKAEASSPETDSVPHEEKLPFCFRLPLKNELL